jgi:hypothetical protein
MGALGTKAGPPNSNPSHNLSTGQFKGAYLGAKRDERVLVD